VDNNGTPLSGVSVEVSLAPSDAQLFAPNWVKDLSSDPDNGYGWLLRQTSSRSSSGRDGNCYLGMAPADKFIAILAKKDGHVETRTSILFTGASLVMVLQKAQ
jgi:hypothetical protein